MDPKERDIGAGGEFLSAEAERVLSYFRQEYWPGETRAAGALQLQRRVVGAAAGIAELLKAGLLTTSMDGTNFRLTETGVDALNVRRVR